ncbi:bilin-binding protein [Danaus plexippus plexippus]|uniref:Bilin-binding protein n=1 Tax=Danaus plexippus plexippus TaxID=278856 RepID=A0A212EWQ0_DANPL|nr:bilin-binding protein [Danaus plexippus plexippus]
MFALLILSLVSTAYAGVFFDSKCPEVKSIDNFILLKSGESEWFEVARYPNDKAKGSKCIRSIYSFKGDYAEVKTFFVRDGKEYQLEGTLKQTESGGKFISDLQYGSTKIVNNVYLLDSDYENYSITYSCKYDEEKKSRQDFVWVASRSLPMSSDIKAKVENFMKASSFLDYDKLIWHENDCSNLK